MKAGVREILSTHTGSLQRPASLVALLTAKDRGGTFDRARYEMEVTNAVADVVRKQIEAGISIINDGEQGKISFVGYREQRLSGFDWVKTSEGVAPPTTFVEAQDFPEFYGRLYAFSRSAAASRPADKVLCCVGPIGWRDFAEVERDIANLRSATAGARATDVFMTAISPGTYAPPNRYYRTEEEYLQALADIMAREYKAIVDAGFILQIDAPDLTTTYRLRNVDFAKYRKIISLYVDMINYAVRDLPLDRVRVHVCWGADEAPHHRDAPLRDIIDILLRLKPAGMSIAGANGRHAHEWRVWENIKLPEGKVIIPGVIDSTTNIIEHPETVAERIVRYASVLGKENMIAGVDCGFDTVTDVGQVDARISWAKLRSLSEGARLASAALWQR
jgi:5-methyltetrahydropteroyltriglutamate--homocysteine methyltransferase